MARHFTVNMYVYDLHFIQYEALLFEQQQWLHPVKLLVSTSLSTLEPPTCQVSLLKDTF